MSTPGNHKVYYGLREGEGGMEVVGGGGGGDNPYGYTVTTRMTYALRCAAMRAILMFHNQL